MVRVSDISKALQQQANADVKRLKQIDREQAKIREQYIRYRDLESERKSKEERIRRAVALVGENYQTLRDVTDKETTFGEFVVSVGDLTLWEAMLAVLEQVSEMQVYELRHVLEQLGKKVSHQAIQSAVMTHRDKFELKARGREKFLSLKR